MNLNDTVTKLGDVGALDRLARPLEALASRAIPRGMVKDALSGTWLGHPLHPLLTDVVIGTFSSAVLVDLVAGRQGGRSAEALIGVGLVAAVPTAGAGLSDWSETYGPDKRVGVVHAAANLAGVALFGASLVARRRGRRARGMALSGLGMGVMTLGGYLGGHLSFVRGIGVNHAFSEHPPDDWTPVLGEDDLVENQPVKVSADGATVLLYRRADRIFAIGDRCSHAGGPLHEGDVDAERECVTCPWHQSVFRLGDGSVVHGPATVPQVAFDVRVEDGTIEVRARQ